MTLVPYLLVVMGEYASIIKMVFSEENFTKIHWNSQFYLRILCIGDKQFICQH